MCEPLRYTNLPIDGQQPPEPARFATLGSAPPVSALDGWVKPRQTTGRRKLWEIPHKYHCPVIGTCLHVDELRRLAEKCRLSRTQALSDYEMHVSWVAAAEQKNPMSMALQRTLDRKYAATVKRFARAKTGDELEHLWDEALASGDVKGALWAIMSHPHAPADMCMLAYADVHMLSHQIGAGLSADLKALTEARQALTRLRRDTDAERQRNARKLDQRDARIAELGQRVQALPAVEQALLAARERIAVLESDGTLQASMGREQALAERLNAVQRSADAACLETEGLRERAALAEQHRDALSAALSDREQVIQALERVLLRPGAERTGRGRDGDCARCAHPGPTTADVDLRGRRILCVGGRGSLNSHYRDLVQRCNGELMRHDGGLEDSRKRLEALLASADAVVCPADYVSHDAYLRTKRYCKRTNKPCVLIERSGIGAFANALSHLASPQPADAAWAGSGDRPRSPV